ncbi:hypothetical protein DICVIV_09983 [Dictyocaulus viviparus]|uniref:BEACH-type PH domain-containing protein n=1 Tax=Dictyocaulus viviparus TaxID=29172 RepID=A0A0D8XH57_DICVI|nr:hypothetical protein DICVIV_09983 [Dictyocaulus viviparus]
MRGRAKDLEAPLHLGLCEMAILSSIDKGFESDIENLLRLFANYGIQMAKRSRTFTLSKMAKCLRAGSIIALQSKLCIVSYQTLFRMNTMEITGMIVSKQSSYRKECMRKSRKVVLKLFEAQFILDDIVNQLCHPECPCFNSRCWPIGWALDLSEGPMRERRKLIPSFYTIDASFFKRERQLDVKYNENIHPLYNIIGNSQSVQQAVQCAVVEEHIFMNLDVKVLRGTMEYNGELLIGKAAIYFFEKPDEKMELDFSSITKKWIYEDVIEILPRQNMLTCNAVEIFLCNGDTYIVVFKSEKERNNFKVQLSLLGARDVFTNIPINPDFSSYN